MVLPIVNPCDYGDPEPCGVNPSFVYTRYPCDFDDPRSTDTLGLPITVDNRTPVKAEVVNRQRESILAVEAELGIQPSGTFTTVRSRLDALEGLLCSISEVVSGTSTIMHQDVFSASASQTVFVLTHKPINAQSTELFISGVSQTIGIDYTLSGFTVTYSGIPALVGGEEVVVKYFEAVSVNPDYGYLGVDVLVRTLQDFPSPISGVITLASNVVYGIDNTVDIGSNYIVTSNGSKIIGGGGISTTSAIISSSSISTIQLNGTNVSIDGITIKNTGTGSAILINAENYIIKDSNFSTTGSVTVQISNTLSPGLGQINDSFIFVPEIGSGILIDKNTTSFLVKNTKFKGIGDGYGTAINLNSQSGTCTISQVVADGCNFENLGISINQENNVILNGNLAAIGCSGINIDTFIKTEIGSVTQAAAISNNIIWDCLLFSVGLVPGSNHIFRGNLMNGIAQPESTIV